MRNILDILGNKANYLDITKQRLLCKKILLALTKFEKGDKLNKPDNERLLKGVKLIDGLVDLCDKHSCRSALNKAPMGEAKIVLQDITKRIETIINGGNTEVVPLKDFFDSLEKYNSVFHVPKGVFSL